MPDFTCSVDGCEKPRSRKGLCAMHYERKRVADSKTTCRSLACDRPAITRGLCYGHYSRLRKGQEIDTPLVKARKRGTATARNELGQRQCLNCKKWLPEESYVSSTASDGLSVNCKDCRVGYRLRRYSITTREFNQILEDQGGVCAICKGSSGKRNFHVDHDHSCCPAGESCGKCIRGLLCSRCNTALGLLKDEEKLLRAAIDYLRPRNEKEPLC